MTRREVFKQVKALAEDAQESKHHGISAVLHALAGSILMDEEGDLADLAAGYAMNAEVRIEAMIKHAP